MKAHQSQGNEQAAKQTIHWMMRVERVKGTFADFFFQTSESIQAFDQRTAFLGNVCWTKGQVNA